MVFCGCAIIKRERERLLGSFRKINWFMWMCHYEERQTFWIFEKINWFMWMCHSEERQTCMVFLEDKLVYVDVPHNHMQHSYFTMSPNWFAGR